jgi:hypothetical protein
MPRTTVKLDASVLGDLKRLQKKEGKSLGRLISERLAASLAKENRTPDPARLERKSRAMGARVDLEDKEALRTALDRER